MRKRKLAIVVSHPIQYYVPVFRALAESKAIEPRVFYTWSQSARDDLFDEGFGSTVSWDVPLLGGYAHEFVPNVSKRPGTAHFDGLQNPTLISAVESWQADAILVYGWRAQSHLQALRHFKGRIPVLFRGDSTLLDPLAWWRRALRRGFLWWVYRHIDIAVAVGTNSSEYFAWCGIPRSRIALAPHSVDTVRFMAGASDHERRAAAWRRELGIGQDAIVFLYAGKFQLKKNPLLLLDAFVSSPRGSHLVFVGSGELEAQLKERAGSRNDVHFLPFQNQSVMPSVYRLGDVLVLPSRGPGETWGLALNEAMACGLAIVASSRVGAARDLIQNGQNGWIFSTDDHGALVAVLRAAVDRGRRGLKSMGLTGQSRSTHWSTQESARQIEEAVLHVWTPR